MLSNQHLYDADKASVAALFAAATTKLRRMGTLPPPAAAGDGSGVVTPAPTPTKGPSAASGPVSPASGTSASPSPHSSQRRALAAGASAAWQ
jgi:hypothetical protein